MNELYPRNQQCFSIEKQNPHYGTDIGSTVLEEQLIKIGYFSLPYNPIVNAYFVCI